jgi:hypothetical protein
MRFSLYSDDGIRLFFESGAALIHRRGTSAVAPNQTGDRGSHMATQVSHENIAECPHCEANIPKTNGEHRHWTLNGPRLCALQSPTRIERLLHKLLRHAWQNHNVTPMAVDQRRTCKVCGVQEQRIISDAYAAYLDAPRGWTRTR